jgi:dTDP-4-amino-4,6-dideoxygalactose transaminase
MATAAAAAAISNEAAACREAADRRANAEVLLEAIRQTAAATFGVLEGWDAGYIRLPVLLPTASPQLPQEAFVLGAARSYPTTLADLPELARSVVAVENAFPGATRLVRELVTLPTHSLLKNAERHRLAQLIKNQGA